jgi:hypothetical protein
MPAAQEKMMMEWEKLEVAVGTGERGGNRIQKSTHQWRHYRFRKRVQV